MVKTQTLWQHNKYSLFSQLFFPARGCNSDCGDYGKISQCCSWGIAVVPFHLPTVTFKESLKKWTETLCLDKIQGSAGKPWVLAFMWMPLESCRPSTSPMATALPSCSGPHSKTTRPAFTVKTARELPKNVIESSRHRRGPPNSPDLNQIEHCAKPDPWRTICGLDSDLSRHGHRTSEDVPGQQWSFESLWSPPTHTPVHKCVTVFLLMATIGRGQ